MFPFQASFVLLFSLICFAFCIISLVYLLGEVNVNLNRLQACWFNNIDDSCTCYTKEQSGFKTFRFSKVANCEVIKGQLRQLVYGVTITFAIGCLISLIAVVTTGYLLCKNQRWKVRVFTPILPYFLLWKFCGNAQFPQNFGRFAQNISTKFPHQEIRWNYVVHDGTFCQIINGWLT